MRVALLLCAMFEFVVCSNAQFVRIEQLFQFDHAQPSKIIEHNGQFFCSHVNGQVSVFNAKNLQPRLVRTPRSAYVTAMYSSDGLLWIHSSAGHLYYSANSGVSWATYEHLAFAVFKPLGTGLYVAVGNSIHAIKYDGTLIIDSITHERFDAREIKAFAVKGDTVIEAFESSDSLYVSAGGQLISRQSYTRGTATHFHQLDDGSIAFETIFHDLFVQSSSLSVPFRNFTSLFEIDNIQSFSIGYSFGRKIVVVSGGRNFTNDNLIGQLNPNLTGRMLLQTDGSLGRVVTTTIHNDTLVMLTSYGKVILHYGVILDSSSIPFPDEFGLGYYSSWSFQEEGITRSLPYTEENGYRYVLYTKDEVRELLRSEPKAFRDSIGELQKLVGDQENGYVASGRKGIAFAESLLGPWRMSYPKNGGSIFRLADGGIVSSLAGNGVGLSQDHGKTWSAHFIKSMFQGFGQVESNANFLAINRGIEVYILPRILVGDTVSPYRYTPIHGGSISILGLNGDTAFLLHPRYTNNVTRMLDQLVLLHVSRQGVLDSIVVNLEKPLASFSRIDAALTNDTIVVYERLSSRYLLIKDGVVLYDVILPRAMREPFASALFLTTTFLGAKHIRIVDPNNGIAASLYPFGTDSTVSVIDQNIWHFYISGVRPNPAKGIINVDLGKFVTADRSRVTLQLCAMDGRIERDFSSQLPNFGSGNEVRSMTLDISGVTTGAYLLVIRNTQNVHSYKVMVER